MQLTQSATMRMDQRQLLTPRMIQSMEILQLPLMALEERIEQELQANPVLEFSEGESEADEIKDAANETREDKVEDEKVLVVNEDSNHAEDFDRLERLSAYLENEEFSTNGSYRQVASYDGERDRKMDAMANTAARGDNLVEHLLNQWAFIETTPEVRKAGEVLINYIDADGYFRGEFEAVQKESKTPLKLEDL